MSNDQFLKPEADFETETHSGQGQGHRVIFFDMHGKVLSQGMSVPNIKGISQLVWEL